MEIILLFVCLLGISLAFLTCFFQMKKQLKNKDEEIQRIQGQLILQEKMAGLGQLTAGIAHEIKNPLNFVHNFAEGSFEIAEELYAEFQKYKDVIENHDLAYYEAMIDDLKQNALDIRCHGSRINRIVQSIMNHAHGESDALESLDINTLVEENLNLAYHGYRALEPSFDVNIEADYDRSIQPVEVIQQDLERVLLNILNNACYALNQKQKEVNAGYKPKLSVLTKSRMDEVEIRICDNGPGIPVDLRQQIFNPFFTTKPIGAGNSGLGLSISHDIIVDRHHGQLKVESEPGKFTEFIIILPKAS